MTDIIKIDFVIGEKVGITKNPVYDEKSNLLTFIGIFKGYCGSRGAQVDVGNGQIHYITPSRLYRFIVDPDQESSSSEYSDSSDDDDNMSVIEEGSLNESSPKALDKEKILPKSTLSVPPTCPKNPVVNIQEETHPKTSSKTSKHSTKKRKATESAESKKKTEDPLKPNGHEWKEGNSESIIEEALNEYKNQTSLNWKSCSCVPELKHHTIKDPFDYFFLSYPQSTLAQTLLETNKNVKKENAHNFELTIEKWYKFLGITLSMGINPMSGGLDAYWAKEHGKEDEKTKFECGMYGSKYHMSETEFKAIRHYLVLTTVEEDIEMKVITTLYVLFLFNEYFYRILCIKLEDLLMLLTKEELIQSYQEEKYALVN